MQTTIGGWYIIKEVQVSLPCLRAGVLDIDEIPSHVEWVILKRTDQCFSDGCLVKHTPFGYSYSEIVFSLFHGLGLEQESFISGDVAMPRNVYAEINLHITWHTKDNAQVLTDQVENRLHHYLKHRILQTPGVFVHEIGGTANHVHIAVSVPPTVPISNWIGELKGASSHHINHEICNRKILAWQDGYGIVSFGTKDIPWVADYIRNQKDHHANRHTHDRLERIFALDHERISNSPPDNVGDQ